MLHLEMHGRHNNRTFIQGKFGKSPVLWLLFVITKIATGSVFTISLIISYFKWTAGESINFGLLIMFVMVTVWFSLYFISEWNKKNASKQIAELNDLFESIAG